MFLDDLKEPTMKKLYVIVVSLLLVLSGCNASVSKPQFAAEDSVVFEAYLDDLLVDSLKANDISINFTFIDPESFGITPEPYDLGFTSKEDYDASSADTKALIASLKEFKDEDLSKQQQMDRNALIDLFERSYAMKDFYDYEVGTSVLGSSRAFMGNVPAYLEKYEFTKARDVDYYLHFIETLEASYTQYVALEKERQTRDTGYSQVELDAIIKQAQDLATQASASDYYLIEDFNSKLKATEFEDQEALMIRNQKAINEAFVSAYQAIADGLSEIEGPKMRGYADMPQGKDYYVALLEYNTGSSRSMKDVEMITARHKVSNVLVVQGLMAQGDDGEDLIDVYTNGPDIPYEDGKALINTLNFNYQSYFPKTDSFNYELKRVHESMEQASSPAFYFSPQIDYNDDYKQVIYAKGDFDKGDYKTYGHESTPGHMYQFTYFNNLPSHPVMKLFTSSANAEGWGNYAEQYVDLILELDHNQAAFNKAYTNLVQALHIELDIGINYKGWTYEETETFVSTNFGDLDAEAMSELIHTFVHNPTTYPTYYLSSIYIEELKNVFLKEHSEWAYDVDFHKAFLEYGSVGFDIISEGFKRASK